MKSLVLGVLMVSSNAFASSEVSEASCRSAGVADGGYHVEVTRDSQDRLTAALYETTIMGHQLIGKSRVVREEKKNSVTYRGMDLKLRISTTPMAGPVPGRLRGKLSGDILPSSQFTAMRCNLDLPEPKAIEVPGNDRMGCLAYFTGALFSPEKNRCIQMGLSGCSNPFEFDTVAECDDAYSMKR